MRYEMLLLPTKKVIYPPLPSLKQNLFSETSERFVSKGKMVGLGGLEPPTSPLSGVRSNQAELQTRISTERHFTA